MEEHIYQPNQMSEIEFYEIYHCVLHHTKNLKRLNNYILTDDIFCIHD